MLEDIIRNTQILNVEVAYKKMMNRRIIALFTLLVLMFLFGTGQPTQSNSKVQNQRVKGSEGESLSQYHQQTYQPIIGNVVRFEKTKVDHETFKFKPFSKTSQNQLTFRRFLGGIGREGQLLDDFMSVLNDGTDFDAYYFECPPINRATQNRPFEFILKKSNSLDRPSDKMAFRNHFKDPQCLSVQFLSTRKDSTLISPCPPTDKTKEDTRNYVHLATFMKNGPMNKKKDLLARSARALVDKMDTTIEPWWFSTAGNGVAWLHIRIDPRPKYYTHVPYKSLPSTATSIKGNRIGSKKDGQEFEDGKRIKKRQKREFEFEDDIDWDWDNSKEPIYDLGDYSEY